MRDRIVNLSSKPRAVVTLQLGEISFRIARVVIAARKLYGDYLRRSGELLQAVARISELEAKREAAATDEERKQLGDEAAELARQVEESAGDQFDRLIAVLEAILEGNGYKLDREWWMQHADQADLEGFIVEALNKDLPPGQKKTEAATKPSTSSI